VSAANGECKSMSMWVLKTQDALNASNPACQATWAQLFAGGTQQIKVEETVSCDVMPPSDLRQHTWE
jgi:hypothetical protein